MAPDLRTMNILKDISNQLDPNIQMTIDVPSVHSNGRLPVLDLEVFLIENKIEFSFDKKPISSPFVIHYASTTSSRTKRDSIIQEGYRRLRNCSEGVSDKKNIIFFHVL